MNLYFNVFKAKCIFFPLLNLTFPSSFCWTHSSPCICPIRTWNYSSTNLPGETLAMVQLPTSCVPNTHLVSKAWTFSIRNISPVIPVLLLPLLPVPSWTVVSSLACWTLPPAPAVHPPHGYAWINLRHKLDMERSWLRLSNVSHQLKSQLLT